MKQMINVVVIFYMQGDQKRYFTPSSYRADNRILFNWSTDYMLAFQCEDESHAREMISKFHNPNNRVFKTEWISVPKECKVQFGSLFSPNNVFARYL